MEKWVVLVLLILAALLPAAGQSDPESDIESVIKKDCPDGYEPVISMIAPNKTYSNPGPPGMYDYKLCISGIQQARIKTNCDNIPSFYISSNSTTAHFSKYADYNLPVCTDNMLTEVRDSCFGNQTPILSVSSDHNAHVGHPDTYQKKLCGISSPPENVTVSLEFNLTSSDTVYFDDTEIGEETYRLAEFPYLVSVGDNYVSGIVSRNFISAERSLGQENVLRMKTDSGGASFMIPFTYGDRDTIEEQQDEILSGTFLDQLSASFSFFIPETPTVRTALDPNLTLRSDIDLERGSHGIKIIKIGEREIRIRTE